MALRDMTLSVLISAKDQLTGVLRKTSGGLSGVEAQMRSSAAAAAEFNTKWAQTINVARGVGAAMTAASAAFFVGARKAMDASAALGEQQAATRRIFGDASDSMLEFGRTAADTVGMANREALFAAASYGQLFQQVGGVGPRAAAEMSQKLVELAADWAAFRDLRPEDTLDALRSGIVGMVMPLRNLGMSFNIAQVEAKAVAMGLAKSKNEVSESAKMLARYQLIVEQSALITGTFQAELDGLANSQRVMRAQIEDMSAKIGTSLQPAYVALLHAMAPVAAKIGEIAESPIGARLLVTAGALAAVGAAAGPLLIALPTLIAHWTAIAAAASGAWAAMTGPVGLAVAGVAALGVAIYALATASDRAREAQEQQMEDLQSGALVGQQALEDMRRATRGMAADLRDVGDSADETAKRLVDMRNEYAAGLEGEDERIQERILRLQEQRNLAVQRYGKESREALQAENRLLEEQQKRVLVLIEQMENAPVTGTGRTPWLTPNEDLQAARDAIEELKRTFNDLEESRRAVQQGLADLNSAQGDLTAVTRQTADETRALADAQSAGEKAATDYARAQRDAARDVEDAAKRVAEAEDAIGEAVEDKRRRVEDASRSVADAQRAVADAHVAAADRIAAAEESAARSIESADERVASIRRRLADLDAPALSPAQQKERDRLDLLNELREAEGEATEARIRATDDVAKARTEADRMEEDALRRLGDARRSYDDTVREGDKRIAEAQKRKADAEEQYARVVERAGERVQAARDKLMEQAEKHRAKEREINAERVRSIDEVTAAYEREARARGRAEGGTGESGAGGGGRGGAIQGPPQADDDSIIGTVGNLWMGMEYARGYARERGAEDARRQGVAPQAAMAGGGRIDLYLHTDGTYTLNQSKQRAGDIIGSVNGQNAVVRIVNDLLARR